MIFHRSIYRFSESGGLGYHSKITVTAGMIFQNTHCRHCRDLVFLSICGRTAVSGRGAAWSACAARVSRRARRRSPSRRARASPAPPPRCWCAEGCTSRLLMFFIERDKYVEVPARGGAVVWFERSRFGRESTRRPKEFVSLSDVEIQYRFDIRWKEQGSRKKICKISREEETSHSPM